MTITCLFLSTLAFADNTAKDDIISFKDPLGSSNSSFCLTGWEYFSIVIHCSSNTCSNNIYTDNCTSCKIFEGLFERVKLLLGELIGIH